MDHSKFIASIQKEEFISSFKSTILQLNKANTSDTEAAFLDFLDF